MNREILFKAKRLDSGEWVEGSLISTEDNSGFILRSKTKAFIPKGTNTFCSTECYEIDPDTLCQFTGLTDKNGEKIWENDIVVLAGACGRFVCKWADYIAKFIFENDFSSIDFVCYRGDEIEAVGNVFDNADLLEVE